MNLARIDLPSLRLVVLCAEGGSLSAAAPRAALSVAGASYKLQRFEDLIGLRLFKRVWNGLEPTEAGLAVIEQCREILDRVGEIVNLAQSRTPVQTGCPICGGFSSGVSPARPDATATPPAPPRP